MIVSRSLRLDVEPTRKMLNSTILPPGKSQDLTYSGFTSLGTVSL